MLDDPHRREVLDHALGLVAGSSWAEDLVLRGSMTMASWVGELARPPGDLDWVLRPAAFVAVAEDDPHPYYENLDPVRHWPEIVHGGARERLWAAEDFTTCGQRAFLPPEGLHWAFESDMISEVLWPHDAVHRLVSKSPLTPDGLTIDVEGIHMDETWGYAYGEGIRARLVLPWLSPDGEKGKVHLDFAYDERLPVPPVLTPVARKTGPALGLWTAGKDLSLAWKLQWLGTDQVSEGCSAGKDLYDAVLLAELPGLTLSRRLRRHLLTSTDPAIFRPDRIRTWRVDAESLPAADPAALLGRLAEALPRVLGEPNPDGTWPAYTRW